MEGGVPEIAPVEELSDMLAGSAPAATLHEYGGVPPIAATLALYGVFNVPSSKDKVVMTSGPGDPMAMVRDWAWLCLVGLESRAVTVKVKSPGAVGFPEIAPELGCRVKPGGSDPIVKVQV